MSGLNNAPSVDQGGLSVSPSSHDMNRFCTAGGCLRHNRQAGAQRLGLYFHQPLRQLQRYRPHDLPQLQRHQNTPKPAGGNSLREARPGGSECQGPVSLCTAAQTRLFLAFPNSMLTRSSLAQVGVPLICVDITELSAAFQVSMRVLWSGLQARRHHGARHTAADRHAGIPQLPSKYQGCCGWQVSFPPFA